MDALIMRPENLITVLGVWILLDAFRRSVPKASTSGLYARLVPWMPLVLCIAAQWLPRVGIVDAALGDKVLLGLVLGFAVGHAHKLIAQSVLGKDERIKPLEPGALA